MIRSHPVLFASAAIVCGLGLWLAVPNWAQEKAKPNPDLKLKAFMRQKLAACGEILEGVTTENAALIQSGAATLTELSKAEEWRVSNDVMYRQFSEEFQRNAKKLAEAAEKGNFDDVTLKWIDTTLSCVECHKFVRGIRIADK